MMCLSISRDAWQWSRLAPAKLDDEAFAAEPFASGMAALEQEPEVRALEQELRRVFSSALFPCAQTGQHPQAQHTHNAQVKQ
jgi:hypothetical protein